MACCNQVLSMLSSEKCLDEGEEEEYDSLKCPSGLSITDTETYGFAGLPSSTQLTEIPNPPNICHELNVAKSLLQTASFNTGDNLFDHLADIIKRVVNDPHENIVDYFEEYSYNLREQKFRIKEPFKWVLYEPPDVQRAKQMLSIMQLNFSETETEYDVCKDSKTKLGTDGADEADGDGWCGFHRKITLSENVLRLHLYLSLCGFNISMDEAIQLSMAMQKIQYLPIIKHARFWGKIYGIKKPYYVVEARLTPEELKLRLEAMKLEMIGNIQLYHCSNIDVETKRGAEEDHELIPGYTWREDTEEFLKKNIPEAAPVPQPKPELEFNVPPEPVGMGVNKLTYFVVNSLLDDWIELPIVTPKQIQVSRKIKRFLTGDLEADVVSFPEFPGNEKHFLRAMIARITAATYVAPQNYYRKMTKFEKMEATGEECFEEQLDEYEVEDDEDNDAFIIEDDSYKAVPQNLTSLSCWVHFRPNILNQGRVRWFNVEKARKTLEKEERGRLFGQEACDEEGEDESDKIEEGSEEESEDDKEVPEIGPSLFSSCAKDRTTENVISWSSRLSSVHNKISQVMLIRSNLWPGAFAFSIEKYSDCIYLGWGCKYTARNISVPHLTPVHEEYEDKVLETTDPTPEMEVAYEMWLKKKERLAKYQPEGECEEEEPDSCEEIK